LQRIHYELANIDDPSSATICSRCTKLDLQCRIDESFKRTRKRKRSVDFEKEIETLKEQLSQYGDPERVNSPADGNAVLSGSISGTAFANAPSPPKGNGAPSDTIFTTTFPNGTSHESPEHSFASAITRPHEHEVQGQSEPINSVVAFLDQRVWAMWRCLSRKLTSYSRRSSDATIPSFPILDPLRTSHAY
jgi:hypothetical protein